MKKMNFVSIFAFLILFAFSSSGWAAEAPYIAPIDDQTATLGEMFTYKVNAVNADPAETYELLAGRPGMTISPSTGLISWTPATTSDGGTVTVRAYNSVGESVRTFIVYISDAIICDDDLISYFKLDETSGSVYEDFQSGYNATSLSPLTPTEGKVDNAQTFAPLGLVDQFAYVADEGQYDFSRSGGFSISLWFRYDGQHLTEPNNQVLIARGSPAAFDEMLYLIMIDMSTGTPRLNFSLRPKSGTDDIKAVTTETLAMGQWYHAVAVYEGGAQGQECYLNIYLNNDRTRVPQVFEDVDFVGDGLFDLNIGFWDRYEANRYPFNGLMDEIIIYKKSLSSSEVGAIYNDGIAGKPHCKPGNYYPLFSSVPLTAAAQDVEYSYTVTASDFDNDPLTLSAETLPSWLTFNPASGLLSGTPDNTNTGINPVSIKATDGSIDIFQNFDIDVTNTNDPPVFTSTPITTAAEEVAYFYPVLAEDPDDDPLVYTTPDLPSWLSFNQDTKTLYGLPKRSDAGENPVQIIVSDGVFQVTQEFTITVSSDNNAPIITSNPLTIVDNYSDYKYTITAYDADPADVLSFSPEIIPSWTLFDAETHTLSGVPEKSDVGDHPVILVVTDGWVETKQEFTITVRDVNTPPVINSSPKDTTKVNELYTYLLMVTDTDGDPITATAAIVPDWLTFNAGTMVLSGNPTNDNLGPHQVMIIVSDGLFSVNHLFPVTVVNATGIEMSSSLMSKVYPNPAKDYLVFEFAEQASIIEITDLSGKVLISREVATGESKVQLNVAELDNGMYMFRVFDAARSQHQSGKVVIN